LQLTYALRPLPLFFGYRNGMPLHVSYCKLPCDAGQAPR
jgi:hypothetical protein